MLPGGNAEKREDTGLYCPMELQKILERSFHSMDKEVLDWLLGASHVLVEACLPFHQACGLHYRRNSGQVQAQHPPLSVCRWMAGGRAARPLTGKGA